MPLHVKNRANCRSISIYCIKLPVVDKNYLLIVTYIPRKNCRIWIYEFWYRSPEWSPWYQIYNQCAVCKSYFYLTSKSNFYDCSYILSGKASDENRIQKWQEITSDLSFLKVADFSSNQILILFLVHSHKLVALLWGNGILKRLPFDVNSTFAVRLTYYY